MNGAPVAPELSGSPKMGSWTRQAIRSAEGLGNLAQWVTDQRARMPEFIAAQINEVRHAEAERQFDEVGLERLKDLLPGGLRLGALLEGGVTTVTKAANSDPGVLAKRIPGVGIQTTTQVVDVARRLIARTAAEAPIRFDVDRRPDEQTRLLLSMFAAHDVDAITETWAERGPEIAEALRVLSSKAAPGSSRFAALWLSPAKRRVLRTSILSLGTLLQDPITAGYLSSLRNARDLLTGDVIPPDPWGRYEEASIAINGEIAEIAGTAPTADALQGYLPAEIAERVSALVLDTSALTATLRGYQAFGAKFALVQERTIIGDEMGLGKTLQAIAALGHLRAKGETHFLAIVPASVLFNWDSELRRHSSLQPIRLHGSDRQHAHEQWKAEGGVALTTFDTLPTLGLDGSLAAAVVVDEAHLIKNPATRRAEAVRECLEGVATVVFLTGTPMENRLEEFRTLVDFLQPKIAETLDPDAGLAGADIFRREVAPVYVRRNQVDVLTELPDLIEHDDWVEMTPEDLKRYRASLGSGNFAQIRQASLGSVPGESAKLDRLLEIEDEAAEEGLKVLVFSFFREALATVVSTARCKVFGPISGDVSPERRQAIVDDFTAHEGPAILAAQIRAGGLGLNIQAASVVVLIEPQWTPTMEDQAIKRAHRAGQTRRVQVHRLLVAGSVDERVLEINHPKRVIFDATARRSDLADASSASTDSTEFIEPNESQIQAMIEEERRRLGVDDGGVTTPNSG